MPALSELSAAKEVILYLYALADAIDSVDGLQGVAGEALVLLELRDARLAAGWVHQPPPLSRETLVAQDRVVRALHARAEALLPFRFGTATRSVETAQQSIDVIHASLAERLARVRGRDQMTVRVLRDASDATPGADHDAIEETIAGADEGPGTRYLRARAAARELPRDLRATFDVVADLARATVFEPARHPPLVGSVYQLIDRGLDADYRARFAATPADRQVTLRISGPSPAYAFAMR